MDWLKHQLKAALDSGGDSSRRLFIAIFVLAVAGAIAITLATSHSSSGTVSSAEPSASPIVAIDQPQLFVHIVGSVKNPGIYKLELGSRVVDAVFAAGGFTDAADQGSLNLARALTDGEQLVALAIGQQVSMTAPGGSSLISLNRATQAELEELPGVGPALAGRLIDWRNAHGGFKAKDDLMNVSGIGQKLFDGVKDFVTL